MSVVVKNHGASRLTLVVFKECSRKGFWGAIWFWSWFFDHKLETPDNTNHFPLDTNPGSEDWAH